MRVKKIIAGIIMAQDVGYNVKDKIITLCRIKYPELDIYANIGQCIDTDYRYIIYVNGYTPKRKIPEIQFYINGIIDTIRSF